MDSNFQKHWFSGFDNAIDTMDDTGRRALLKECGKACSDSYPRKIFADAYLAAKDMDDLIGRITSSMTGISIDKNEDGSLIVSYPQCYCELVTEGLVQSPKFCECSRQSLLYNWEAVAGEGHVDVTLLQTVLEGKDSCRFLVMLDTALVFRTSNA